MIVTIRWLYGPVPGLFFVIVYFLSRNLSLTRERLSEIQAELARRHMLEMTAMEGGLFGKGAPASPVLSNFASSPIDRE